jgi:nucleotide-binding universal stress UspA family protein
VAAVFRGDELIVPTGETTLEVDDRVLLVGDPRILGTVAEYLRLGTPQFPGPYGPNVVTCEFSGPDEKLHEEAAALARDSGAYNLRRGVPGAEETELTEEAELLTAPVSKGEVERGSFSLLPVEHDEFLSRIKKQRPGVVLVRAIRRSLAARALGLRGEDAELCDLLPAPVVFARGTTPYKRILLTVSGSDLDISSAEMAIDITRQLSASLTAVNVDLPRYISGLSEEAIHREVVPIRRLCELYEVPLTYRHHEGNPVRHILHEAKNHDLVVMARRYQRRDTFFDPDVALRIARKAPCSVIVLTVRPEE